MQAHMLICYVGRLAHAARCSAGHAALGAYHLAVDKGLGLSSGGYRSVLGRPILRNLGGCLQASPDAEAAVMLVGAAAPCSPALATGPP